MDFVSGLIRVEAERIHKITGNAGRETQLYITSVKSEAERLNRAIRQHWSVENKLHWTHDVSFGEGLDRKCTANTAQNCSVLNRIALNLLQQDKTTKLGIERKRLKAGWDNDYLLQILGNEDASALRRPAVPPYRS